MSIMNPKEKRTWMKALRSGLYTKGRGVLRRLTRAGVSATKAEEARIEYNSYCCLGVACHAIGGVQPKLDHSLLRQGRFGLSRRLQEALACANDGSDIQSRQESFRKAGFNTIPEANSMGISSFHQLANWIDKNL